MKRKQISYLPLLIILAVFFGWQLYLMGAKYIKTSLTMAEFDLVIAAKKAENGIDFAIDIVNGGPLDIGLALMRIRLNKQDSQYIWFSSWNFQRDEDIVKSHTTKRVNLFMELPEEKLNEAIRAPQLVLFITGLYDIPNYGDLSFNRVLEVSISD